MRKHPLDHWMNRLCLLTLTGAAAFLVLYWQHIPSDVPVHFNAAGEIDRWGSKEELLILPIISWLMYGLMTAVEYIPGAWNTGSEGTGENQKRVFALLGHMLGTLKLLITALFTWITVQSALALPLPEWFLPVVLGLVFGDMIHWLIRVFRPR